MSKLLRLLIQKDNISKKMFLNNVTTPGEIDNIENFTRSKDIVLCEEMNVRKESPLSYLVKYVKQKLK